MSLKYPDSKIFVEYLDISSLSSIDDFQLAIDKQYQKVDIFINNAGVYNLPTQNSIDGYEMHFAVNTLGNYYLAKKIVFDLKPNAKMIFTSSIAYNFSKIDFNDIQSTHIKNKLKIYAISKRIMTFNAIHLKNQLEEHNICVNIAHPGISATQLFKKGAKFSLSKLAYPLMKVIFHNPNKASLAIIKSIFVKTSESEWIGPRGLFHIWGYPKVYKLAKSMYKQELYTKVNEITENMIIKHAL